MAVERSVLLGKSRNRIDILATEIWFSDIVLKLVDFYGETKVSQKVRTVLPFCICRLCWFSKYVHILTFCHLLSVTTALWRGSRETSLFPLCGGEQNYEAGGPAWAREGTPRKLEAPDHITTAYWRTRGAFSHFYRKENLSMLYFFFFPFILTSQLKVESKSSWDPGVSWSEPHPHKEQQLDRRTTTAHRSLIPI